MLYPWDEKVYMLLFQCHLPKIALIKYSLAKKSVSIEETFSPLAEEVRQLGMKVDKTILFTRYVRKCDIHLLIFQVKAREGKALPGILIWRVSGQWICSLQH